MNIYHNYHRDMKVHENVVNDIKILSKSSFISIWWGDDYHNKVKIDWNNVNVYQNDLNILFIIGMMWKSWYDDNVRKVTTYNQDKNGLRFYQVYQNEIKFVTNGLKKEKIELTPMQKRSKYDQNYHKMKTNTLLLIFDYTSINIHEQFFRCKFEKPHNTHPAHYRIYTLCKCTWISFSSTTPFNSMTIINKRQCFSISLEKLWRTLL